MGSGAGYLVDAAEALESAGLSHREYCGNCGTKFSGRFCLGCGEECDTHRRSLAVLPHNLIEDVLSFDSPIQRTAIALIFRPEVLPCAFREGRIRRYAQPHTPILHRDIAIFSDAKRYSRRVDTLEIVGHPLTPEMHAQVASHTKL